MKCKNCGTEVSETANFCRKCGTKIEEEIKPEVKTEVTTKSNDKDWGIGTYALISFIILFLLSLFLSDEPRTVNEQSFEDYVYDRPMSDSERNEVETYLTENGVEYGD